MIKIKVFTPDYSDQIEYYSSIVPIAGDKVQIKGVYYKVTERTLFEDNPNYVIIHVVKN